MKETRVKIPNGQNNSLAVNAEKNISVNFESKNHQLGKSVGYVPMSNSTNDSTPGKHHWFPIRATYHRAKKVYDKLVALNDSNLEPYLPMQYHIEYTNEESNNPTPHIIEEPLDKGLLFVRTSLNDFRTLLRYQVLIPGLTPYYNHFATNEFGKNEFLIVPDRQMESFRIIVESRNQNIIVNQTEIPKLIEGDQVMVTNGPFAGVEGTVMKYKHQKRVFVELKGVGSYATAYVPGAWIKRVES